MNPHLQSILNFIQQDKRLTPEEKNAIAKSLKDADKELEITTFKLDRTEKIKKTTAILLEETIEELEQKRKAVEAQNRELEIEAALERVRFKAMAMQKSEDLANAVAIVFDELDKLNLGMLRCGIGILNKEKRSADVWTTTKSDNNTVVQVSGDESMDIHPLLQGAFDAWLNQSDHSYVLKGKDLNDYYKALTGVNFKLPESQSLVKGAEGVKQYYYNAVFSSGGLFAFRETEFPEEAKIVLKRFADVFNLTYTRFNDLKQAEAQGREAKIELGLERVRARAMAMQNSDELKELIGTVFTELTKLDLVLTRCLIMIYDSVANTSRWWMANSEDPENPNGFYIKRHEHPPVLAYFKGWSERQLRWTYVLEGQIKKDWDVFLFNETELKFLPDFVIEGMKAPDKVYLNASFNNFGNLTLATLEPLSDEHFDILLRFAKVFDLTYTRFNDLQKAEAQAREAQIEVSLERVRSRAMAMHKTDELLDAAELIYKELSALGITSMNISYAFVDEQEKYGSYYSVNPVDGKTVPFPFVFPHTETKVMRSLLSSWKKQEPFNVIELDEDATLKHQTYIGEHIQKLIKKNNPDIPFSVDAFLAVSPKKAVIYNFNFAQGYIFVIGSTRLTTEQEQIVLRFTKVFELTYRRFLDLKQAEAQSREAQIELALERVRAKTMAMQNSSELPQAANLLFEQIQSLGMPAWSAGYCIWNDDKQAITLWMSSEGVLQPPFNAPLTEDPSFIHMREAYERGEKFYVEEVGGKELKKHYEYMRTLPVVGEILDSIIEAGHPLPTFQIFHLAYFSQGFLLFITYEPVPEAHDIFKRFGKVFEQTYTRFLDLQKAEAQAKEAKIEASLERVRSKAMAMHSSQDLADTIVAFYHELEIFSITPRRCGVGLLNKETRIAELSTMNTTEDGKSIEIIGKLKMVGHKVLEGVFNNWLDQKEYHPVLRGSEIKDYYQLLKPQIEFPDYPNDVIQYGYFFFFPEGGVYAWTDKMMAEEELIIYRRFTSVLSLTYKRYKDLQQAEELAIQAERDLITLKEEKKKTEEALSELKITQKQLIQSEKMASLGELTAGIAHEIQNPLNFVNNFSEVSNELLDDMITDLKNDNKEDAFAIASDVKQNLEKILHHGKRADGIVKGMLQHSRSSSATKEPTDINQLADEYLRLAYHGLRAKDKSFNAIIKTDFDESVGNINIIPQDIGRAILNLITNAFYAVTEKKKQTGNEYEPTVWVSTKKIGDKVLITVKDNGNGIPQKVVDKIFQPFFTTKPTGQGTGLGLSLSYDIVKAHGGELKVETSEESYTEFIIYLPAT